MPIEDPSTYQWTFVGPREDPDEPGSFVLEIAELPGFVVLGESKESAIRELPEALSAHLQAYREAGRTIPKPAPVKAGWMAIAQQPKFVSGAVIARVKMQPGTLATA